MPHIYFEHSSNISQDSALEFAGTIHATLVRMLPTKLSSCKTRLIEREQLLIADGDIDASFIHIAILILPGRTQELKNRVADEILRSLQSNFLHKNLNASVSIENLPEAYARL